MFGTSSEKRKEKQKFKKPNQNPHSMPFSKETVLQGVLYHASAGDLHRIILPIKAAGASKLVSPISAIMLFFSGIIFLSSYS